MTSFIKFFLSASMLTACGVFDATARPPGDAMFQAGPSRSGVQDTRPMGRFKQLRFAFQTGGMVRSTPALSNGALYFGSGDEHLYALDARSGRELWRYKTGGAVHSSPAVAGGTVWFTSRDGNLYALDAATGTKRWALRFGPELPYQYGFDYYTSSPAIEGGMLFVGAGDGKLYAVDAATGEVGWAYPAGSRIRSSPAVSGETIVFGTVDGRVIALGKADGTEKWTFATQGAAMNFEEWGFDRAAVISSPSVADGIVTVGCRDGFLYALDLATGELKWKNDHRISWAISTPGRADGLVYCGSSDARFYQCLDAKTGEERWKFDAAGGVWSSPAIAGNELYFGDFGGHVYGISRTNGREIWRYTVGAAVYASPTVDDGVVFCGSDDGVLYAFEGTGDTAARPPPMKAVFWDYRAGFNWFRNGVDVWVRDYFTKEGYELLDSPGLVKFLTQRAADGAPSVVVFAENRIPDDVSGSSPESSLVRSYLDSGGKVVLLGPQPLAYLRDSAGQVVDVDFSRAGKIFGVRYPGDRYDRKGWYGSRVTADGTRWGLTGWWVGLFSTVETDQVTTVLALDEFGMAGAWVKNYGGPEGTGLVQLWIPPGTAVDLTRVKAAAEHGF